MRIYRPLWRAISGLWIAVGVAAGVIVLPRSVWIALGLLALVLFLASQTQDVAGDDAEPSRLRNAGPVVVGYFGAIATLAAAVFLDFGAVIVAALLLGSSPPAITWYLRKLGRERRSSPVTVSTSQLCRQWLDSYDELHRASSQAARLRVVMARQRCLDELERRDPAGLQAWLDSAASAGGDPRRFLSDPG